MFCRSAKLVQSSKAYQLDRLFDITGSNVLATITLSKLGVAIENLLLLAGENEVKH